LIACDQRRYNDLDGRGNLSQSSLIKFTKFFLETCIDQVKFMRGLVQPDKLRHRIVAWADEEAVTDKSFGKIKLILEAVLYRGELPRSDVPELLGVTDRQARRIVSHLLERGVLCSKSDRTPLRLAFSIELASRWMPGLFPEKY
jgi:Fic family protein